MKSWKKILLLFLLGTVALTVALNIKDILKIFPWIWHILEVLVIGGCIAFVVNIIMDWLSNKVFTPDRILDDKIRKTLNLVCSLLIILFVIILVLVIIIPQLANTFRLLFQRLPQAFDEIRDFLERNASAGSAIESLLLDLKTHAASISSSTTDLIKNFLPKTFSAASTGVHSVMNIFIALIFSLYILLSKKMLMRQGRKLTYALLPEKAANEFLYILHLLSRNFRDFIYGRFVDALSMAVIYAVAALILRIPDTLMITTMIAVFCLVPLFGAVIAWAIGFVLIITVEPVKAIIFTVLIVVIMLIARNVIYPRVIGTSIGLPDIWVLAAIIIGGKMLGLLGMILAVPVFGVFYTLIKEYSNRELDEKKVDEAEIDKQPDWEKYNTETMKFD